MFDASDSVNDGNHRGLFYMLGLLPETRLHLDELFDYSRDTVRADGLAKPWQTAYSIRATRLAFNLFNGFKGFNGERQIEPESLYTPDSLFDPSLCEFSLEACRIRYDYMPRYERETARDDDDLDLNLNIDWDTPSLSDD